MVYERVAYMCPKCHQGHFYNNSEEFSTICSKCNVEMVCVEKITSTEQEEAKRKRLQQTAPTVYCPYCNSLNTSKISTASKMVNTVAFGIFGTKRHKTFHCNNCGYEW